MIIEIPWPGKLLWPNGSRGKPKAVAAVRKKYKDDVSWLAIKARQQFGVPAEDGEIPIKLIVHAKPKGPLPDKDNCVAAIKSALDAIAGQIGVNDQRFAAPVVEFATPRNGTMRIYLGESA